MYAAALGPLKALQLQHLDEPVSVYFRPEARERALRLAAAIHEAEVFFGDSLDVQLLPTLAVLSESDWSQISNKPYGSPYVGMSARLIHMPEKSDGFLPEHYLAVAEECLALSGSVSLGEAEELRAAARRVVDLVLFHEIGHAYAASLRIDSQPLWFAEFIATYIGYSYLYRSRPADARAWNLLMSCRATGSRPPIPTLAEFAEAPVDLSFLWFQAEFARYVAEIYPVAGLDLVRQTQAFYRRGVFPSTKELVQYLDGSFSGFRKWAEGIGTDARN
jgi:hypothetical protein